MKTIEPLETEKQGFEDQYNYIESVSWKLWTIKSMTQTSKRMSF